MTSKDTVMSVAIVIGAVVGVIILLYILGQIFGIKIGRTIFNYAGSLLVGATKYTGIFGGFISSAVSAIGNLINF